MWMMNQQCFYMINIHENNLYYNVFYYALYILLYVLYYIFLDNLMNLHDKKNTQDNYIN